MSKYILRPLYITSSGCSGCQVSSVIYGTSKAGRHRKRESDIERGRARGGESENKRWKNERGEQQHTDQSLSAGAPTLETPSIHYIARKFCYVHRMRRRHLRFGFWISVKSCTVHRWTGWSIGDSVRYGWSIVRCCHPTIGWHGSPLRCSTWRRPCGMGCSCASSSTTWDPSPSTWGRSTWDHRCHR